MGIGTVECTLKFEPGTLKLIERTAMVLDGRNLPASADEVQRRVLAQAPGRFLLLEPCGKSEILVRLKPYAELALREVVCIAGSTMDTSTRARRISEALSLAGF